MSTTPRTRIYIFTVTARCTCTSIVVLIDINSEDIVPLERTVRSYMPRSRTCVGSINRKRRCPGTSRSASATLQHTDINEYVHVAHARQRTVHALVNTLYDVHVHVDIHVHVALLKQSNHVCLHTDNQVRGLRAEALRVDDVTAEALDQRSVIITLLSRTHTTELTSSTHTTYPCKTQTLKFNFSCSQAVWCFAQLPREQCRRG